MGDKAAEQELHRLRGLPENKVCPNCEKKASHFGFTAVVVPFRIFVCDSCKSAHQAFSHRCKSATMSNWTMAEVLPLQEKSGGGNKACLDRLLAGVPAGARLGPDSHLDDKKRFVDQAYNKNLWQGEPPSAPAQAEAPPAPQPAAAPAAPARQQPCAAPAPAATPAPVPQANLLDFEPSPAPAQAPLPTSGVASALDDMLFDPAPAPLPLGGGQLFAGLSPAPVAGVPAAQPAPAPPAADLFDPFGPPAPTGGAQAPAGAAVAGSAFSFVSGPPPAAPAVPSAFSFVGAAAATEPSAPQPAQPTAQVAQQSAPAQQPGFSFIAPTTPSPLPLQQQQLPYAGAPAMQPPLMQQSLPMQPPLMQQSFMVQQPPWTQQQPPPPAWQRPVQQTGPPLDRRWLPPQQPQKAQPKQAFDFDAFATVGASPCTVAAS